MPGSGWRATVAGWVTIAAVTVPTLVVHWAIAGYGVFGQLVASLLWGLVITAWALADRATVVPWRAIWPLLAGIGLTAVGVAGTWLRVATVPGPIICALGLLAATAAVVATAARVAAGPMAEVAQRAFALGLVLTALLGAGLGAVQLLAPQWIDGFWISRLHAPGRAIGNLVQPNHLSTFLLWGLLALLLALHRGWLRRGSAALVVIALALGMALAASRTGLATLCLLALWGLFDRSLPRTGRALLMLALVLCLALFWALPQVLAPSDAARAATDLGRSSARSGVYSGALALIAAYPWLGVGWFEFGSAWALAPQAQHDGRFFDHTHNLVLNLCVELGLPLSVAILAGLAWALRPLARRTESRVPPGRRNASPTSRSRESTRARPVDDSRVPRCNAPSRLALAMLAVVGLHSMVEFPLWYAYLLLPTAWIWGHALGSLRPAAGDYAAPRPAAAWQPWSPIGVGVAVAALVVFADFARALPVNLPKEHAMPLAQRLALSRQSRLFGHLGDHVAATQLPDPPLSAFRGARQVVIDGELMQAWAGALARAGRIDEARHVAMRHRAMAGGAGSALCSRHDPSLPSPLCRPPERPVDWRKLR